MQIFTGIDVGNFDVKSPNTTIPSGYTEYDVLPAITEEYLEYNGKYYVPSQRRFNYKEDKTDSERCLILSLLSIAQELRYKAYRSLSGKSTSETDLAAKIKKYDTIALGAGLPPQDWQKAKKTKEYYEKHLSRGIEFSYCGIPYGFDMNYCALFPQGWAAIITNPYYDEIRKYNKFVAIDIGGGTMDIVPFVNGLPATSDVITDNSGSLYMYKEIIKNVRTNFSLTLEESDIEAILMNQPTVLPDQIRKYIIEQTEKWTNDNIIDFAISNGINFKTTPSVFLGGTSKQLERYIKKNDLVKNTYFLCDPRLNARGYAVLVKSKFSKNKSA